MPQQHAVSPDTAPGWHARSSEEVLAGLETGPQGLDPQEAAARLEREGRNELSFTSSRPWWMTLLKQFISPVIFLLMAASIISVLQHHYVDAVAIAVVLVINASLGFYQERKAERDVRALQSLAVPTCRVLRAGAAQRIAAPEVVPGDIVLLESGERVPADLRLLDATALQVDESMLTGESLAATKHTEPVAGDAATGDKRNTAFSGTFVISGRGQGVVTATGEHTQLGQINELVQTRGAVSPLQKLTHRLERIIGVVVFASAAIVFLLGLLFGQEPGEMLRTSVALVVATIPESLPIILTVAMAVGVSRMARLHAVVRTLPSVETLGSTTVIASDKTGTLTQNRLTVERIWTPAGALDLTSPAQADPDPEASALVLRAGALANEAARPAPGKPLTGDAVDVAMAEVALAHEAVSETERTAAPLAHTPYEPELGYCQAVVEEGGRRLLYMKGAPEAVLRASTSLAGGGALDVDLIHRANEAMAAEGLRVIATGMREIDAGEHPAEPLPAPSGLIFLGMEGMADPPRPGARDSVEACHTAGITVKMVTGDHPVTAQAIARRLGIDTAAEPLTGKELAELDEGRLAARLEETNVIARVSPQDKLRIVRGLDSAGEVVAVTGDGVNDAPALKAASIGVAMGHSGTDVAREASDLVLTDDDFTTIVDAVRQGRVTFAAIRKATLFLLSTGAAALFAVALSVVLDLPLLFVPLQMLWINLVTNGVQDIALTLEPAEGDELQRPPRPRDEGVLSGALWLRVVWTGIWMAAIVLIVFHGALDRGLELDHARSLALTTFVMLNFFQVGNSRALHRSLLALNPLGNKPLLYTSLGALLLHWAVISWEPSAAVLEVTALSLGEWVLAALLGSTILVLVEAEKLLRRLSARRDDRSRHAVAR